MKRLLIEGIGFSIVVLLVFGALDIFLHSGTFDYSAQGFPLIYYESWGPCISPVSGACVSENPQNYLINLGLAIISGFGILGLKTKLAGAKYGAANSAE